MRVYHDDNHEPVQPFDEVVFVQQPCSSTTPCHNLPKTSGSTPIITSTSFQNQPTHTNIHLVPTNLEIEQLHLQYPTYVKDTNSDAHIRVFKKAIKANGEIMEANIINFFGFIVRDNVF